MSLKQPGQHRRGSSGNERVQDGDNYACEVDLRGEPSGNLLVLPLVVVSAQGAW